jgi:hypothetical protein
MREHFDRAVRQIARYSPDEQPLGLETSAVTKIHSLNFPKDEKTASDLVQFESASVRLRDRCLGVLRVRIGEGGGGVVFGFHRGVARSSELLRLEVRFGARNGGLGCVEIRRCCARRACRPGGGDGLPSVAHFLHGSSSTSDKAGNTDKYSKEAQHRVVGH